jgi:hypothetical protein
MDANKVSHSSLLYAIKKKGKAQEWGMFNQLSPFVQSGINAERTLAGLRLWQQTPDFAAAAGAGGGHHGGSRTGQGGHYGPIVSSDAGDDGVIDGNAEEGGRGSCSRTGEGEHGATVSAQATGQGGLDNGSAFDSCSLT